MFDWLFGSSDKGYGDADEYLQQAQQMMQQAYQPYMDLGNRMMPIMEQEYMKLMSDPAAMQQMLGAGYQQSPGYQFQYDQAMNASNSAASAGGLLGTQAHSNQNMGYAQGLANQDYWNYYNQNAQLYGAGLAGNQGLFDTGYNATNNYAQGMGNLYGSQANLSASQAQTNAQGQASLLGAGLGMAGKIWGPKW